MALPDDFNEWEHLQHTIRKVHNDAVRDFYHTQPDNDIGTNRAAAKHACLMKDNDTVPMTTLRMWLFWVVCRKMRDNFEPYYGIPISHFDSEVKYKPQITCYFQEDIQDVDPEYRPVEGQLSIRVTNKDSNTITQTDLTNYANQINSAFGSSNGFVWKKGKTLYSYCDKERGHRFKIFGKTESHAQEIIQKLLSITNEIYDPELLNINAAQNPAQAYPTNPGKHTILGKSHNKPRKRPIADVRFQYASMKIHGLPKPIVLVDKTGYWSEAIIPAY